MRSHQPTPQDVSKRMAKTHGRDNAREIAIRSGLHKQGLRFRIHYTIDAISRRTIDIAFPRLRLAVFCDGCFWHGCPKHRTFPRTNASWWLRKIDTNIARDQDTSRRLRANGWKVVRIWGHVDTADAVRTIAHAIEEEKRRRTVAVR